MTFRELVKDKRYKKDGNLTNRVQETYRQVDNAIKSGTVSAPTRGEFFYLSEFLTTLGVKPEKKAKKDSKRTRVETQREDFVLDTSDAATAKWVEDFYAPRTRPPGAGRSSPKKEAFVAALATIRKSPTKANADAFVAAYNDYASSVTKIVLDGEKAT